MATAVSNKVATQEMADPAVSARAAGLRYVLDSGSGIRRQRAGEGFYYVKPDGDLVRDEETLGRIKSLAIPPAWNDVWICPDPRGHIQAAGRDAKGRKQFRYHPQWKIVRDAVKYDRMIEFAEALPRIREHTDRDLALPGTPREKVLATVVQLLETTLIRVGNEEYRRRNESFGLTTLRDRHVEVHGSTLKFHFRGKGGKEYSVSVTNQRLARAVHRCQEIPGHELFQYTDENGERHAIESGDVNSYLREISGGDFTAKDFRTWWGTVTAARMFRESEPCHSKRECEHRVAAAVDGVAVQLGNTRAISRRCYIHPMVVDAYLQGALPQPRHDGDGRRPPYALSEEEQAVLDLLRQGVQTPRAVAEAA